MKVILNQQITYLLADEELENEIKVEDYHLCQSDDPNDIYTSKSLGLGDIRN